MINALQINDYEAMAQAMFQIGMINQAQRTTNVHVLAARLKTLLSEDFATDQNLNANDLHGFMIHLSALADEFGIHFPKDFALLLKQILYFDRFINTLAPDMALFEPARLGVS